MPSATPGSAAVWASALAGLLPFPGGETGSMAGRRGSSAAERTDRERQFHDAGILAPDRDHIAFVQHLRRDHALAVHERLVRGAGDRHDLPSPVGPALEHALAGVPELCVVAELAHEVFADFRP